MRARKSEPDETKWVGIAELQRGRACEGAEIRSGWYAVACPWCFNGAAPVRARKSRHCRKACRPSVRFNGAAPVRARKCSAASQIRSACSWLQRGRACEGAEIGGLPHVDGVVRGASTGPRLCGRGNARCRQVDRHRRTRFNWAALVRARKYRRHARRRPGMRASTGPRL